MHGHEHGHQSCMGAGIMHAWAFIGIMHGIVRSLKLARGGFALLLVCGVWSAGARSDGDGRCPRAQSPGGQFRVLTVTVT